MSTRAPVTLTFAIYEGDAFVRRESVTHDILRVGTHAKSHVHIEYEGVARMHLVIEVKSVGELNLTDLGTETVTRVNGERVSKCALRQGDRIEIGSVRLELERVAGPVGSEPATPAEPSPARQVVARDAPPAAAARPVTSPPPAAPSVSPDEVASEGRSVTRDDTLTLMSLASAARRGDENARATLREMFPGQEQLLTVGGASR